MKTITRLKDEARRHEQNDQWEKAIQAYLQVLRVADEGEGEVELPLYNRIGDLYVRLGRPHEAVGYYEQAADRYADAGLFNNAIALCNKALRYNPDHNDLFRKLGRFSASQGFFSDARRYFLEFADRKFRSGNEEEGFGALEELARASEDAEVWELLGRRLLETGRKDRAVRELQRAYTIRLRAGEDALAAALRTEISAIDRGATFAVDMTAVSPPTEQELDRAEQDSRRTALPGFDPAEGLSELEEPEAAPAQPLDGFESTAFVADSDADDVSMFDLPDLEPTSDEQGHEAAGPALEGLESTSLDLASAAADLDGIEIDPEMERDEPFGWSPGAGLDDAEDAEPGPAYGSFEIPSLDEGDDEDERAQPPPFTAPAADDDDFPAFSLPSLYEEQAGTEPLPDDDEETPFFPLPTLDDDEGPTSGSSAGDEDDAALPPLPSLDDTDDSDVFGSRGDEATDDFAALLPRLDEPEPAAAAPEPLSPPQAELPAFEMEVAADREDAPGPPGGKLTGEPAQVEPPSGAEPPQTGPPEAEVSVAEPSVAEPPAAETSVAEPPRAEPPRAEPPRAEPPRAEPPRAEPPAAADAGFIDLAELLAEHVEETTRFRMQEAAPTGDEDHDFAELLKQFKAKLSEHLPAEDAAAHYDLGLAFKDMGLVDEAIAEFQIALRAGHMRLKVVEELGQCFLEKRQYNIAEKVLRRALDLPHADELELLGVYYYLGQAYEQLKRHDQARDAYERVLGMDINFRDTAERLARL